MLTPPEVRLEQAYHVTDLHPGDREVLIGLIEAEIRGDLQGVYSDVSDKVYHHPLCPGFSSTTLKTIRDRSFNHWFRSRGEKKKDLHFGSAFHKFRLEPKKFNDDYYVVHASRRNDAAFKDAETKNPTRDVILFSEFQQIEVMSKKIFEHPGASMLFENAQFELVWFARCPVTGLWRKAKTDIYQEDDLLISDLKSTRNASEDVFRYDSRKFLTRISLGYYTDIVGTVTGKDHEKANLVACEKEPPVQEVQVYPVYYGSLVLGRVEATETLITIKKIIVDGPKAWRGYSLNPKPIEI